MSCERSGRGWHERGIGISIWRRVTASRCELECLAAEKETIEGCGRGEVVRLWSGATSVAASKGWICRVQTHCAETVARKTRQLDGRKHEWSGHRSTCAWRGGAVVDITHARGPLPRNSRHSASAHHSRVRAVSTLAPHVSSYPLWMNHVGDQWVAP
jgi:hypothetical protein